MGMGDAEGLDGSNKKKGEGLENGLRVVWS